MVRVSQVFVGSREVRFAPHPLQLMAFLCAGRAIIEATPHELLLFVKPKTKLH